MSQICPDIDPDGLLEYSVVYTDRSLNHMSQSFQGVMRDISATLKQVYNAHAVAVVPGSGTFGMEAVARQFANGQKVLIVRNGWFSYRWTQIFEMGQIPAASTVLKARPIAEGSQAAYAPAPLDEVLATIAAEKPQLVFAPHVETSSGMILPDDYLRAVSDAVHAVGGLLVLDCIASGTLWVDMQACGIDVLISAPQKGWSASPCCALVMLSEAAQARVEATQSTSFACDLKKWLQIMEAYESGGHADHDGVVAGQHQVHQQDLAQCGGLAGEFGGGEEFHDRSLAPVRPYVSRVARGPPHKARWRRRWRRSGSRSRPAWESWPARRSVRRPAGGCRRLPSP